MDVVEKVSDVTAETVAEYLNLVEPNEADINLINNLISIAKSFILKYTGQTDLDMTENFVIVLFILVQDMWDNRTLYVSTTNLNKVVETILGMYSVNLL